MSKLVEYVGVFHSLRESVAERWTQFRSRNGGNVSDGPEGHEAETNFRGKVKDKLEKLKQRSIHRINRTSCNENEDYSHLTRPKSRKELLRISAAVMGIEFSYAAETAFVSPLLLNLGVPRRHMTLMWFFSPLLGFFMTPILGSLSDGCRCPLGKRRPFILLLSIGIVLGLILVPNGRLLGLAFGDKDDATGSLAMSTFPGNSTRGQAEAFVPLPTQVKRFSRSINRESPNNNSMARSKRDTGDPEDGAADDDGNGLEGHTWGLVFTVLGTVLLDFDADACQSPSRAYMLDVTIPEDHAKGLSTFTVMAGLGGSLGYLLGAFNWEDTFVGTLFGGQVRAVFTLVLFIFIACVVTTIRSFREIPIDRLYSAKTNKDDVEKSRYAKFEEDKEEIELGSQHQQRQNYGAVGMGLGSAESSFIQPNGEIPMHQNGQAPATCEPKAEVLAETPPPTFIEYVKTIVALPRSLQWLCVTNYFCWMSLVCYSLFFTDFVGQAVFGGSPTAPKGSPERKIYEDGVRFGCLGMSLYSLSCSGYSMIIEGLVCKFGAKQVYIYGQLVYSVGMVLMGLTRHPVGVILLSWTAGIMYATLFTMPYLLVARYHAAETFELDMDDLVQKPKQVRGLGTDVAVVSSMVFLAQMTQAVTLGSIVSAAGSSTAIVFAAAVFAACGSFSARKVLYLDL